MPILLTLAAVAVGILVAVQPGINAQLGRSLGNPFYGTLANFTLGFALVSVTALFVLRPLAPKAANVAATPWWAWLGGILGAIFVTASLLLIPRLGAVLFLGAVLVGQLLAAGVIDQFGLVGLKQQSLSPTRIAGLLLLIAGLVLVQLGANKPEPSEPSEIDTPAQNANTTAET
ncbi:MAG: DMT family transporter [Planctomycetota bacterium]